MTPFESWYSLNVAPKLAETLQKLPPATREPLLQASRESMAACWNAALRTVAQTKFTRADFPPPCQLPAEIREQIAELEARVTP